MFSFCFFFFNVSFSLISFPRKIIRFVSFVFVTYSIRVRLLFRRNITTGRVVLLLRKSRKKEKIKREGKEVKNFYLFFIFTSTEQLINTANTMKWIVIIWNYICFFSAQPAAALWTDRRRRNHQHHHYDTTIDFFSEQKLVNWAGFSIEFGIVF